MRVCFVSREVAGIHGGGIGTYVVEAGKALAAQGHEVWLVTCLPAPDKVHLLDQLSGFFRVVPIDDAEARRLCLFHGEPHYAYAHKVHETIQSLGVEFDYIEFPDYQGEGYVALLEQRHFASYGRAAMAVMMHSPTWECFSWSKQSHRADIAIRELCSMEEAALRIAPLLHAPSARYSNVVRERLALQQPIRVVRCPMVFGSSMPEPARQRAALGDVRFVYLGRIEPRKGVEELLDAFAQMPELSIDLIGGDVPYSPFGNSFQTWLQRKATPNVRFLGNMPRPHLLTRLAESDVCVLPSLLENYPYTCTESMAAGRVVVGSVHGGMSEMIQHGESGFLTDGRSPDAIVRTIRHDLAGSLDRLDDIGRAAAVRAREFSSPEAYVASIEAAMEAAASIPPPLPATARRRSKVSVIVPFFQDFDTIDECIDSAVAQDHEALEVLIVDDGSPAPEAAATLDRQAGKDARVRVLHKPNGGLGSARNFGVEHTDGDFILFLDADNKALPAYAETAASVLEAQPTAQFVVPYVSFFRDGGSEVVGTYNPVPFDRATALLMNRFGDAGAVFRRSVFAEHGLRYDEIRLCSEDWGLWMDLDRLGLTGECVPRILYDYRVRDDSMIAKTGRPNHPVVMGLLIARHFGGLDEQARAILTTIFQTAGGDILNVMTGNPPPKPTTPQGPTGQRHAQEP